MYNLKRFANIHKGETCVIIGNGPSLNSTPLKELAKKYVTFGSNKIYKLPFTPHYYCVIDEEMLKTIRLPYDFQPVQKFIRAEYLGDNNPIYPIVVGGFSLDISNFVVMGGTVTFAMLQLAFYMGFETMLLVGVDHNYPATSKLTGHKFIAGSTDIDHFLPADGKPYFDTGKEFNAPEDTTPAYAIARDLFDKTGRRCYNLTKGSKLTVFDMDDVENWL
jgi:hypothetical protein